MGTGVGCHCSFLLKSLGYTWRASAPVKGHGEAMAEDDGLDFLQDPVYR